HRVGQTRARRLGLLALIAGLMAKHKPVHDGFDGVVLVAVQLNLFVHLAQLAVHADAYQAGPAYVLEDLLVVALTSLHQRCEHLDAAACWHAQNAIDNLLGRLRLHRAPADRAVGCAHAGIKQTQIVVNLGDGAYRRTWVMTNAPLVDGNRRAQPFDLVYGWLLQLAEKLPGVGRERLDITALSF